MRFYRRIGLMVVCLIGVSTFTANAHPRRIHIHGAICQFGGAVSGVVRGATPGLTYSAAYGATATGANVTAVCPLDYVLDDLDMSTGPVYVTAWMSTLSPTTPTPGSTCRLEIDQPAYNSGWFSDFVTSANLPWAYFHGLVPATGPAALDNTGATGPTGLRVVCTLMNGASINSIEVKVEE
jgi:hypothetical protein